MNMGPDALVYWEFQEPGKLTCGMHCLNTLLQGPFFDEVELSQIALQIDAEESKLLGGHSPLVESA